MCNCREQIVERLANERGLKNPSIDFELLSGKTYSTVIYTETVRGKEKEKTISLLHGYCPWCGEKYADRQVVEGGGEDG